MNIFKKAFRAVWPEWPTSQEQTLIDASKWREQSKGQRLQWALSGLAQARAQHPGADVEQLYQAADALLARWAGDERPVPGAARELIEGAERDGVVTAAERAFLETLKSTYAGSAITDHVTLNAFTAMSDDATRRAFLDLVSQPRPDGVYPRNGHALTVEVARAIAAPALSDGVIDADEARSLRAVASWGWATGTKDDPIAYVGAVSNGGKNVLPPRDDGAPRGTTGLAAAQADIRAAEPQPASQPTPDPRRGRR